MIVRQGSNSNRTWYITVVKNRHTLLKLARVKLAQPQITLLRVSIVSPRLGLEAGIFATVLYLPIRIKSNTDGLPLVIIFRHQRHTIYAFSTCQMVLMCLNIGIAENTSERSMFNGVRKQDLAWA
jgi:hypothetical protein